MDVTSFMCSAFPREKYKYNVAVEEAGGAYCFWDVCASARAYVRPLRFLMHSITSKPCMLGVLKFDI